MTARSMIATVRDPRAETATQLRNIEQAMGVPLADVVAAVHAADLAKHGQIVAFLKSEHGLTHGNANALAHAVREQLAGGPAPADDLLAAQYAGAKAALRPVYDRLAAIAESRGNDVTVIVQKTGVAFRRAKQFAVVRAASSTRVQLGLNLDATPDDTRVSATTGMCTHSVDVRTPEDIDPDVVTWITQAYAAAGRLTKI